MFKNYNPKGDDRLCLDEWVKLTMEGIFQKIIQYLYLDMMHVENITDM